MHKCVRANPKTAVQPLLGQLIRRVAVHIELQLGKQTKTKKGRKVAETVKFKWSDPLDDSHPNAVSRFCVQYVCNAVVELQRRRQYTMATDKGWCNGLNLQHTVIGLMTNFAALCTPVVGD